MNKTRLLGILGVLVSVFFSFCAGREVDQRLYGVWRSSHDAYKASYMEISPEKIVFGNDTEDTEIGTITGFKYDKMPDKTWAQCTVKYRSENSQPYELQFFFNTKDAETIVFKNQKKLIWKKGFDRTEPSFETDPIAKKSIPVQRTKR